MAHRDAPRPESTRPRPTALAVMGPASRTVRAVSVGLALAAALALAPGAWGQSDDDSDPLDEELDALLDAAEDGLGGDDGSFDDPFAEPEPLPRTYPSFEHHGYFRFRADLFYDAHLDTVAPGVPGSGTSAVPAPLGFNAANAADGLGFGAGASDDAVLASANIRLRYSPTIHVAPQLRVKATVDILDNLVLGSTPDFADDYRSEAGGRTAADMLASRPRPFIFFSEFQDSPAAGQNGVFDALRLREVFLEWHDGLLVRAGRMAIQWGLGMTVHNGMGPDDDYGDVSDRLLLGVDLGPVSVSAAYDFVFAGSTNEDPADWFGQPKDVGDLDDVRQAVVEVTSVSLDAGEARQEREAHAEAMTPNVDWGARLLFRHQGYRADDEGALLAQEAWALVPDLWLRYEQRLDAFQRLRVEVEAAGVFGHVQGTDDTVAADLQQFGLALELAYQNAGLFVELRAGLASGDADPTDGTASGFRFDPGYLVDQLLFREVMRGVSNAFYLRPGVGYDLFSDPDMALGARLDVLVAHALEADATPGGEGFYGAEIDAGLFFHDGDTLRVDVETGVLIPGPAFRWVSTVDGVPSRDPSVAFTLQARLTFGF